jgi:DNA polymerase-3 subunit beta
MKLLLRTAALAGAIEASAKNDIRNYLNGVLVDLITPTDLVVVATDGHIMYVSHEKPDFEIGSSEGFSLIIPKEAISAALKGAGPVLELRVVTLEGETLYSLNSIGFKPIDGKFPEYNRVIPKTVSGEAGQYDIDLLGRAYKAVRLSNGDKKCGAIALHQNGESGAVVQGVRERTQCVIMPRRITNIKASSFEPWVQPERRELKAA